MPDMDSPQISGLLGESSAAGGVVMAVHHVSKRPREDESPILGKRGRGENGDVSLTVQLPLPAVPLAPAGGGNCAPLSPTPLCESPCKLNQAAQSSTSSANAFAHAFAPFSGGSGTAKPPCKVPEPAAVEVATVTAAATPDSSLGAGCPTVRRKNCAPSAAPRLGATDPIFHAALLRLLHRRSGKTCPEALGWRWRGDAPARFDHWPCALHPSVMDLLACVSAGEERVVLTGCDVKEKGCGNNHAPTQTPPPPPREAAWRVPRPRIPAQRGSVIAVGTPVPASPASTPVALSAIENSAPTPLSALRRPGSTRRCSHRVRFSTHDMSVVDTPDPARGGSEEGMVSTLDVLESILSAAEQVRGLAAGAARGGDRGRQHGHYEGYFDRFSSAGQPAGAAAARGEGDESEPASDCATPSEAPGFINSGRRSGGDGAGEEEESVEQEQDAARVTEAKGARDDAVAFVGVLDEIASGCSAPEELALSGGWGPEHSNAAAFYAKELALLCGVRDGAAEAGPAGAGGHLRVRYLDVLSCLVRYNLKILLNVCVCDVPEADATDGEPLEVLQDESEGDADVWEGEEKSPSAPALTVVVPGRAALLREQRAVDAALSLSKPAKMNRGCGCVTVLDGTGALEFNTEDVAALLTLALARVRPFMPLAARLVVAAEEAGWDGGDKDGDELDARVWATVQQYTSECRAAAATAAANAGAHAAPGLFSASPRATSREGTDHADGAVSATSASPELVPEPEEAEATDAPTEATDAVATAGATAGADSEDGFGLSVDEAADLLEYVAGARFIAQLIAEPVVAAGISAGRWACTERLAEQVRKLAEAEAAAAAAACSEGGAHAAPSLSNMLCLGELADVQGLGMAMAQQARYAPALEAMLKGELRRALRRGQGSRQRRIKNRLQQAPRGAPDVFSFPMVAPCCCFAPGGAIM